MPNTIRAMLSISLVLAVVAVLWAYANELSLSRLQRIMRPQQPTAIISITDRDNTLQPVAIVAPWAAGDAFDAAGHS